MSGFVFKTGCYSDASGWDGNDKGGANNVGGARVGDEDDFDDLEEIIRVLGL